jgi:membrane protease YdiL (CAAX protease family)
MTLSLIMALVWLALAQATGLLRQAARQRVAAVVLTILGIPLLGWVTTDAGPYVGLALLAAGAVSLCWPLPEVLRAYRREGEWREPAE